MKRRRRRQTTEEALEEHRHGIAEEVARASVSAAFRNRRGHGGAPITRRSLSPDQLQKIVQAACIVAIDNFIEGRRA